MPKLQHLLLATLEDTSNPRSWSGIPYSLKCALEKKIERVTVLDKLPVKVTLGHGILRKALGGNPPLWPLWATDPALKQFGSLLDSAVAAEKPDAVLTLSSQCLIHHLPSVPLVMFSDAPWLVWKQTYLSYEKTPLNGPAFARKEAEAVRKCAAIVFASPWAVEEGRKLYGITDQRFHTAPFGATWVPGMTRGELEQCINLRGRDQIKLLFVGRDWERKGGPLAVEVTRRTNEFGVRATLDIVGARPQISGPDRRFVTVHGPFKRGDESHGGKLRKLFLSSHFLIVPTNAECFGIVFAEALAHALPVVTKSVQAVPWVVKDGQVGIVQQPTDDARSYAIRIIDIFNDHLCYKAMCRAAYIRYEEHFTWELCAGKLISALEKTLQ